jgi:hypothetical protein
MRTENEIKALPLEEKQKLVTELRAVKTGDKAYANAKAIIELITASKGWEEPVMVEVKNIAGHEVTADEIKIAADATAKVFPWQLAALARFLEPVSKAAALLLFCLLLGLGFNAQAFDNPLIAGLNGGTNNVAAASTNSYNVTVTNSVVYTNANWSLVNNQWTNQPTYSTNSTYTTPGVFSLGNYDMASVQVSLALDGAGTTAVPCAFSTSDDGVNFVSTFTLSVTPAGTALKSAITNLTLFAPGWIRLDTVGNANATDVTNLTVSVGRKQSRTGP